MHNLNLNFRWSSIASSTENRIHSFSVRLPEVVYIDTYMKHVKQITNRMLELDCIASRAPSNISHREKTSNYRDKWFSNQYKMYRAEPKRRG